MSQSREKKMQLNILPLIQRKKRRSNQLSEGKPPRKARTPKIRWEDNKDKSCAQEKMKTKLEEQTHSAGYLLQWRKPGKS